MENPVKRAWREGVPQLFGKEDSQYLERRSTLTPHTRNPVVMGAVLKNNQIAEKFYEHENDLVRVTVTVAEKPPHVLEEDRRKNGTRKRNRNNHPVHADQ